MAGQDGPRAAALALLEAVRGAPGRFDLYQVLRRIECAFRDKPRLGEARLPADEPIRLGQDPTMAFATHPIAGVEYRKTDGMPRVLTQFLGVFGPHGPLPLHLTDHARDRLRNSSDAAFARFVDLFHHRLLSLYYRAFANAEPAFSADRPEADRFSTYVGALFGLGVPSVRDRDSLPDAARLYFAGRLAAGPKNAEGLAAIISELFGVPVRIEEMVGEWVDVPERSRWRLGGKGRGARLGTGTTLGGRAWMCQGKFRVVIGPLDEKRIQSFLPGSQAFKTVGAVVRSYAGDQLAWDLKLVLDKRARTPWRLGRGSRLGYTSGLGYGRDRDATMIVKEQQHARD